MSLKQICPVLLQIYNWSVTALKWLDYCILFHLCLWLWYILQNSCLNRLTYAVLFNMFKNNTTLINHCDIIITRKTEKAHIKHLLCACGYASWSLWRGMEGIKNWDTKMKKNNEKERWQCAWRPGSAYLQRVSERVDWSLKRHHIGSDIKPSHHPHIGSDIKPPHHPHIGSDIKPPHHPQKFAWSLQW